MDFGGEDDHFRENRKSGRPRILKSVDSPLQDDVKKMLKN